MSCGADPHIPDVCVCYIRDGRIVPRGNVENDIDFKEVISKRIDLGEFRGELFGV